MFTTIREDFKAVFAKDQAAWSTLETIFCYPGLHALRGHRVSHYLWQHKLYFCARVLSHFNWFLTNIEIRQGVQ